MELLERFDDNQMRLKRAVLMEALERHKNNSFNPEDQDCRKINSIYKHIYIMDLSGLQMKHFSSGVRRVVQNVIIDMGNLYPESVCKMIFVNSPFAFRAIWGMLSPFLLKVTIEKTKIVGSGNAIIKELEKCGVSVGNVPEFCGGSHKGITIKSLIEKWRDEADAALGNGEDVAADVGKLSLN